MSPTISRLALLSVLVAASACGGASDSPTQPNNPADTSHTAPAFSVSPAQVAVGDTATVAGAAVSSVTAIAVDGSSVPFTVASGGLKFAVASSNACDVDGRPVHISLTTSSGSVPLVTKLLVKSATQLDIGQSHIYTAGELACIQLPAGKGYVISVLNLRREQYPGQLIDSSWTIVTGDTSGAFATGAPSPVGNRNIPLATSMVVPRNVPVPSRAVLTRRAANYLGAYSGTSTPYVDPNLATAQVGDSVRVVDFASAEKATQNSASLCSVSPATVPRVYVKVAAVSGKVVILVDPRISTAAQFLSAQMQPVLTEAARLTDKAAVEAIKNVYSNSYAPLPTAGGRIFALVEDAGINAPGYRDYNSLPNSWCGSSDELNLLGLNFSDNIETPGFLAGMMVYQLAKIADIQASTAIGPNLPGAGGFAFDSYPTNAQETAARIIDNQTNGNAIVATSDSALVGGLQSYTSSYSGWPEGPVGSQNRDNGWVLILKAREIAGQSDPSVPIQGQTLFEKMVPKPRSQDDIWTPDEVGGLVGVSGDSLLDQTATAMLTDDLVDAAKAAQYHTPQISSYHGLNLLSSVAPNKFTTGTSTLNARLVIGGGAFWYSYIFPGSTGVGFTAKMTYSGSPQSIIKVTRLN